MYFFTFCNSNIKTTITIYQGGLQYPHYRDPSMDCKFRLVGVYKFGINRKLQPIDHQKVMSDTLLLCLYTPAPAMALLLAEL
jgi:hypothetical protein